MIRLARTVSGVTTGGFAVALQVQDVGDMLARWPSLMPTWETTSSHMAVSPPGWAFLYHTLMAWGDRVPAWSTAAGMAVRPFACDNIPLMEHRNAQLAAVIQAITAMNPARLIYVSSDLPALARDGKKLAQAGYKLVAVQPIDMTPQAFQIDTVSLWQP